MDFNLFKAPIPGWYITMFHGNFYMTYVYPFILNVDKIKQMNHWCLIDSPASENCFLGPFTDKRLCEVALFESVLKEKTDKYKSIKYHNYDRNDSKIGRYLHPLIELANEEKDKLGL